MLGWLFGRGVSKVIDSTGTAVQKVYRTVKGDKAEAEQHVHSEQMAVLAQFASEFASRPPKTWWDSCVDGLNRLVRPAITFWMFGVIMLWPFFDTASFTRYVISLGLVPQELWTLFLALVSFWFGGRIISQDLRQPRMTEEQKKQALEVIRQQQEVVKEASKPLIVPVAPTRKPPPPAWACEPVAKKPPPVRKQPSPSVPPKIVSGRPADVDRMIVDLIKIEGGFVNDPSDSGGATCWGVTKTTLESWRQKPCTVEDVKCLTREEAAEVYRSMYYFGPSIDSLPVSLQAHVLDCAVNMGPRTAVKLLQRALKALGADLKEDGIIGPLTRDACNVYDASKIHNQLVAIRVQYYQDLAARRPKDKKFLNGWLKRARSFAVAA